MVVWSGAEDSRIGRQVQGEHTRLPNGQCTTPQIAEVYVVVTQEVGFESLAPGVDQPGEANQFPPALASIRANISKIAVARQDPCLRVWSALNFS